MRSSPSPPSLYCITLYTHHSILQKKGSLKRITTLHIQFEYAISRSDDSKIGAGVAGSIYPLLVNREISCVRFEDANHHCAGFAPNQDLLSK